MTLGLGIVSKWGAWVSTDYRVTWSNGGTKNDASQKHLVLRCPDGGVLLAYTGLAEVGNRTVNEWACGLLRGTTRTIVESLQLVCAAASEELAPICTRHRIHHVFMFAAFVGQIRFDGVKAICDETWAGVITNEVPRPDRHRLPPEPVFSLSTLRVGDKGWAWGVGSGRPVILKRDEDLIARIAGRPPSQPIDYCNVLGGVNKRVAPRARGSVSEACSVTFMPPTIEPFSHHILNPPAGLARAPIVPLILLGFETTYVTEAMEQWEPGMSDEELQRRVQDALDRSDER